MIDLDEFSIVTDPATEYLNQRQQLDYRQEREDCLTWLLTFGKNPDHADGYARGTVKPRSQRMDKFYRFVWEYEGGYTINVTHDHADAWMTHLAQRDVSATHKCNCQKAIKMLFKWQAHERGRSKWDPKITFTQDSSNNPREYLTLEERAGVREAALEYGSVPNYNNLTPAERDRWKAHLA